MSTCSIQRTPLHPPPPVSISHLFRSFLCFPRTSPLFCFSSLPSGAYLCSFPFSSSSRHAVAAAFAARRGVGTRPHSGSALRTQHSSSSSSSAAAATQDDDEQASPDDEAAPPLSNHHLYSSLCDADELCVLYDLPLEILFRRRQHVQVTRAPLSYYCYSVKLLVRWAVPLLSALLASNARDTELS